MITSDDKGVSVRRLRTFLTNLTKKFAEKLHKHNISDITDLDTTLSKKASSEQGAKADTAVQSVKIGTTEYKSGTTVTLPSYPTSLPANGGNASTVNGYRVNVDVPSGAKFTDTTYSKLSEFTDDVGYVKNTDSRLSDSRNAKDVYSWAKQASKPTYTASEVGAMPTCVVTTQDDYNKMSSPEKDTLYFIK